MSVYLLGSFQVRLNDRPLLRLETGKTGALLAYLATETGRAHSRRTLADLLWPERSNTEALKSLRFALSNLRAALQDRQSPQPVLLIDRSQVQLNPQADVWVDVAAFLNQAVDCEISFRNCDDAPLEALQASLALYRGNFLQGFNLGDSLEFETWALNKREQLERQRLYLLHMLAAGLESSGSYSQAEETYRSILEVQPWDENIHRRIMRLLASNGQFGAALAQYEACCQALSDLEIEPGFETNSLYHRIKKEQASPGQSGDWSPGSLGEQTAAPFVFRERELDRLDAFLMRSLAGQRQVALIIGEAGSGKTALMRQFVGQALARHPHLLAVGGCCDAYAGLGQPFQPFIESVQMLAGEWESLPWVNQFPPDDLERLHQTVPLAAEALFRTAPDLLDRFIDRSVLAGRLPGRDKNQQSFPPWQKALKGPAAPTRPANLEIGVLFEQVAHFFREIARQKPLVLLLDDLQWADAGSLSLLFHLSRRLALGGSRLLIVGAYRPHDLLPAPDGAPHPLLPIIRELQRDLGEIELDLEQAAGRPFVDALLDSEPNALDESFRAQLCRATGGHALFTVELVREMRGQGGLVRDKANCWIESPALNWGRMPARVEGVIARRLERLPASRLALLSAASVEGENFSAEALAGALNLDLDHVLNELNGPMSRAHLVRALGIKRLEGEQRPLTSSGQRLSHFCFRHALFQTYLYGQLNAVERARLHEAVGSAQEKLYGEQAAMIAAQLARHFENAGLVDKAADYLLLAGQRAYWLSASEEATNLYRHALVLLETQPDSIDNTRRKIDLELALYTSLLNITDRGAPEQEVTLTRAFHLAQRLGNPERLLPVLYDLTELNLAQGKPEQALVFAQQFASLADQVQEPEYKIMGHHLVGMSCLFLGDPALGREQMEQSLDLYCRRPAAASWLHTSGAPDLGVPIRAWLSLTLWLLGYPDQALALNREALELVDSANTPAMVLALSAAVIVFQVLSRQTQGVRQCIKLLQRLVTEKNLAALRPWVSFYQGWLLIHGDQSAVEGVAQMDAAMPSLQALRQYRLTMLAEACLFAEQFDKGQQALDEALALVSQDNTRFGEAEMHRLRGELVLREGVRQQSEEAEVCFRRAIDIAQRQKAKSWELRATISLTRLWAEQGRREEARTTLAGVYDWFTEGFDTPDLVEAAALLVELEGSAG
ncbi:MAG: AAA family ATPase [Anaerolineales bacterium]|nr:AAA family ATPase [Anaerolineales bacterium]